MPIRPARPDDYALFERLFPELGNPDPVPKVEAWDREIYPQTLIAEEDGQGLGLVYTQFLGGEGYVRIIITDPDRRRAGVGRSLMMAVRDQLLAGGATAWRLNVKPHNEPALALYRSLGFVPHHHNAAILAPWEALMALPQPPPDYTARLLLESEQDLAQRVFDLPPGQLAYGRAAGRIFGSVWDAQGTLHGLAMFDPLFPGAFPFRATTPSVARVLAELLRPYTGAPALKLVVEDAPELRDALVAAGATLRQETLQMVGSL